MTLKETRMTGRFQTMRNALVAAPIICLMTLAGCDNPPKALGTQTETGSGSSGLTIDLEGPLLLEGEIPQPQGIEFPIRLKISGPADGAVRITAVNPPIVDGCDLIKGMPMYMELGPTGRAEAEGTVLFASDLACAFGFKVVAAAEFRPGESHYELYDPVDEAEVSMTFKRKVDPGSPEAIRFSARQECEQFVREEMQEDGHVESFSWSPAFLKELEGKRYQAEGSFFINNVSFEHRCTMDFNKTGGWSLKELEVPGLDRYRSERAAYGQ